MNSQSTQMGAIKAPLSTLAHSFYPNNQCTSCRGTAVAFNPSSIKLILVDEQSNHKIFNSCFDLKLVPEKHIITITFIS